MVAEQDAAVGADDQDPGQLAHIPFGNTNTVTFGQGCDAPQDHCGGEQRSGGGLFETKGLEKPFLRFQRLAVFIRRPFNYSLLDSQVVRCLIFFVVNRSNFPLHHKFRSIFAVVDGASMKNPAMRNVHF